MKEFTYEIVDPAGIHARPAGQLVKLACTFQSVIRISKGEKTGDLKRIFSVMALGVKKGDSITVQIEGADETTALVALEQAFKANL